MNSNMAEGASERLDAQIADALFGQPGMSKMDVANRLRELRGAGTPLLCSSCYGLGVIGYTSGQTPEQFEQGEYPCPDCAAQPSPAGHNDALVDTARRNIRQFISKASFSSSVDKQAALSCVDVLEEALAARQPVGATVKDSLTVGGEPNSARNRLTAGVAGSITRPWEFRDALLWAQDAADCSSHPDHKAFRFAFTELLAMIGNQDVPNG